MKEIKNIINAFDEAKKQNMRTALATVVHVDGSSYRRPGARMLIREDGMLTGAISGGCLEGDALRKAFHVIVLQKKMLVTYDTTDEDDAVLGVGLGCNGVIRVLIEPIDPSNKNNSVEFLRKVSADREGAALATIFSVENKKSDQRGTCLLSKGNEIACTLSENDFLKNILFQDSKKVIANQKSIFRNYIFEEQNLTAFIEYIRPAVSLVIIGAGNDVIPLVDIATVLGWDTTVIDGRQQYAKKGRFETTCKVFVLKPEEVLEKIAIDERTVFLLMTHSYNYDYSMLKELIKKNVRYIGSLGPKKKLNRMLKELHDEGIDLNNEQRKKIYGPCGLDIGAETPEEIALSILAEIQSVFAEKNGLRLRNRKDVIHSRSETLIEKVNIEKL